MKIRTTTTTFVSNINNPRQQEPRTMTIAKINRMKWVASLLVCLTLLLSGQTSWATSVILSSETVDPGTPWEVVAGGVFWDAATSAPFFTSPGTGAGVLAGTHSALLPTTGNFVRLNAALSGLTVQPGRLVISAQIGNPNNSPFPNTFRFLLHPNATTAGNVDLFSTYIVSSSTPTPALGEYVTWTAEYFIPATEPTIGDPLQFLVQNLQAGTNLTVDGLATVTLIPEPSTGLLLGFGLFGLVMRRRRGRE